jgi:hypothetical protein
MVKPTPARFAEPWIWPQLTPLGISASRNRITIQFAAVIPDLPANEQGEQNSQAYGIGQRLCDSGVRDGTALNSANSDKITL